MGNILVKTEELLPISSYKMFPKKVTVGTIEEDYSSESSDG